MGSDATTLGDFIDATNGSVQTGPFGTKLKASEYTETGVPVISVGEVGYGRIRLHGRTPKVDNKVWERMPEYLLKTDDIVFGRKGGVERSAHVQPDEEGYFLGSDGIRVRLNPDACDPRFIAYQFQSESHKIWMLQHAAGTTMPSLNEGIVRRIPITIPPLPEQKAIAHILGSLDDKIELNRRMNATLEGMAQVLFKSWFVDFDPVIDNALAAGNPIPDELADRAEVRRQALADGTANREAAKLFPAAFQQTESLGWIPEGWEVKSIAEVADKIGMGPFGSRITRDNFKDEGVPIIRGGNLTNGFVDKDFVYLTEDKATELKSSNVFPGDIIFTHRGTIGQVGIIPMKSQHPRYVASQSQMFLRINKEITSAAYAFSYFKTGSGMERLLGYASQVGVPAIARPTTSLKSLPILIPELNAVEAFDLQNTSYVNKINACDEQMETLIKLRDALLPKLISGEVSVSKNTRHV